MQHRGPFLKQLFLVAAPLFLSGTLNAYAAPAKPSATQKPTAKVSDAKKSEQSQSEASAVNQRSLALNEQGARAVLAKDFKLAEDLFLKALAEDRNNLTAAYNLAGMYLTNNKNQDAIDLLKSYSDKNVKEASVYSRLGEAYFATKKVPEAIKAFETAFTLDAKFPSVPARLGTLYSLTQRLPDAESMFLKAVEQNPKDGSSLASLSSVFLANKKPNEAISTAKRALQVKATSEVYVTMGSAYEAINDYRNSLIAFERAAALDPKREDIQTKIDELNNRAS